LVSIWHILKKREVDQHASELMIARAFLDFAHNDLGVANLPGGMTAAEFTRQNLDRLGIGKDLVKLMYGRHTYLLPQSSLPGAAPALQPSGRSQVQNTKAAQAERAAKAQAKREALAEKRAEAEARMGRPRKTRSDKGTKRGPHSKK
ncbi:MAG: hypothetical protein IT317_17425, partial [Anaerolineales bacterium]|nr:hypothetical protein [Anaerolineales bacterium]